MRMLRMTITFFGASKSNWKRKCQACQPINRSTTRPLRQLRRALFIEDSQHLYLIISSSWTQLARSYSRTMSFRRTSGRRSWYQGVVPRGCLSTVIASGGRDGAFRQRIQYHIISFKKVEHIHT